MTSTWRWTLMVVAAWAAVTHAQQQAPQRVDEAPSEGVSRFVMGTRLGYIHCSNQYRAYLEKWELYALVNEGQGSSKSTPPSDEAPAVCVHETLVRGRALYNDATRQAASPATRNALREYHSGWEKSLQTLRQPKPEKLRDFRERQKRVENELDTLQTRLEAAR